MEVLRMFDTFTTSPCGEFDIFCRDNDRSLCTYLVDGECVYHDVFASYKNEIDTQYKGD